MRLTVFLLASAAALATTQSQCSEEVDGDGDGYTSSQGDCNDSDPTSYPGAPELCDGSDNDCDGATDDVCPVPGFQHFERATWIRAWGEDNGRAEPPYYDVSAQTSGEEYFDELVSGVLEHVISTASQRSAFDEDIIWGAGTASASGADDYGYGQGAAEAESHYQVAFEVTQPLVVTLELMQTLRTCNDGGDALVWLELRNAQGPLLLTEGATSERIRLELPVGSYQVAAQANADVVMSGGGDAYPCGEATFSFELWRELYY